MQCPFQNPAGLLLAAVLASTLGGCSFLPFLESEPVVVPTPTGPVVVRPVSNPSGQQGDTWVFPQQPNR